MRPYFFFLLIAVALVVESQQNPRSVTEIVEGIEAYEEIKFYFAEEIGQMMIENSSSNPDLEHFLTTLLPSIGLTVERPVRNIVVIKSLEQQGPLGENEQVLNYTLQGRIIDKQGRGIQGVIFLVEIDKSTYSGTDGYFEIVAPSGVYTFNAQANNLTKSFQLELKSDLKLTVEMDEKIIRIDDVVVTATREVDMLKKITPGEVSFSVSELERLPSFLGEVDINQTIKNQAGVTSIGEGSTGFNVRGGQIDQNLILLNDIPVFNSSHLLGFFSIFNPDFVQSFSFNKGTIPASLGGRISSTLEVQQKVSKKQDFRFNSGIGPMNSSLTLDIPIKKLKSGLLIAGRAAYPTWLIRSFPRGQEASANYYDINLNYDLFIDDKQDIEIVGYLSSDKFQFSADTTFRYSTSALSLSYTNRFSDNLSLKMVGAVSQYRANLDTRGVDAPNTYTNGIRQLIFKSQLSGSLGKNQWSIGTEYNRYTAFDQENSVLDVSNVSVEGSNAFDLSFFAENEFLILQNLRARVGIRQTNFFNIGEQDFPLFEPANIRNPASIADSISLDNGDRRLAFSRLEPRASINYLLNAKQSIKLGYSRTNQFLFLLSNTNTSLPTDLWYLARPELNPTRGDQISLGYYATPKENFDFSVEGFAKRLSNVSEIAPGAVILNNNQLIFDILQGDGRSYGVELTSSVTRKRNSYNLNYTLSRTQIRIEDNAIESGINNGSYFPASYDRRHVLNYSMNIFLSRLWSFGSFFTYASGRPYTSPGTAFRFNGFRALGDIEINDARAPAVHRLDISFTYAGSNRKNPKWETSWTFSIYNLYGHKNPFSVIYQDQGGRPQPFEYAILGSPFPFITFNVKKI